ncbi:MAG: ATP-binding protein [Gordonibacter pamelaeae]
MEGSKLDGYLSRGEGLSLEFKRCGNQPGADTFETICSFANRQGGSILLGVLDDGAVEGIDARAVSAIERNIVNVVNNPDLFNVPPAIEFERITFGGGGLIVLRIWVPMGPMVFRFRGTVYDRAADADIRVKSDAKSTRFTCASRTITPSVACILG